MKNSFSKLVSSAVVAAVIIAAPGPLAYNAAAQSLNLGAVRAVAGVPGAAGAAAARASAPTASLTSASALAARAGAVAAPASAAPAALAAAAAAPAAVPAAFAAPAAVAAPADASAQNGVRALGAQIQQAAAAPSGDPGKVLDQAYERRSASAVSGAAPVAGQDGTGPSALKPAAPASGAPAAPSVPAANPRFQVSPIHKQAMKVMAWVWKKWDDHLDHKWWTLSPIPGTLYLYLNEQALRLRVFDTNAIPRVGAPQPAAAGDKVNQRSADGSNLDENAPRMGMRGTSFNRLAAPVGPDNKNPELMTPNPYEISEKLQKRGRDAAGNPVIKEAGILNDWATAEIQGNVHDWFNHKRKPIADNPMRTPIPAGHPLAATGAKESVLDRTEADPTLPKNYRGPNIYQNDETAAWDFSSLYGSTLERQLQVRAMKDGKMKIGADGRLLDDPEKPGVPLTGFNDNMSPQLAMWHTVWTLEHNHVADAVKAEHPTWNDEQIFQMARLRLSALNARLHTTEWTRALLPNEILQQGMWADWYGFTGKRLKNWILRFSYRHPVAGKVIAKLLRYELFFGIPGTPTNHFGKNYNFVEQFPEVYRLHTMLRDSYKIQSLTRNADGTVDVAMIKDLAFKDTLGFKTNETLRQFDGADLAFSYGMESAGALTLKNSPDALRILTTQDGRTMDLGAVDIIRARERLGPSAKYVQFVRDLGETAPKTFEDFAADQATADLLRSVYKNVEDVDFNIGILAEKKPDAFALGNRQFKVFVLSAPWRLKNDRFLSEQYDASVYGESGMDYIEHNNFGDVLARAWPKLRAADVEALENAHAPWAKPGTLLERTSKEAVTANKDASVDILTTAVAGTAIAMLTIAATTPAMLLSVSVIPAVAAALAFVKYVGAQEEMKAAVEQAKASPVAAYLGSERATKSARTAKLIGSLGAYSMMDVGGMIALHLFTAHPIVALAIGIASVAYGVRALKSGRRYVEAIETQRVQLKAGIDLGVKAKSADELAGDSAIAKRYWFLLGDKKSPVATFSDSYAALLKSGLPKGEAFMTAAFSHFGVLGFGGFARKTQKNMTAAEKAEFKPGFFDIYVPNMIDAAGYSNTNVYDEKGDVDMAQFDRLFREFGMRDYLTAYDLARIREANQYRDARLGRGNWLTRTWGRFAAKRRAEQLLQVFADKVVWEDEQHGRHVPAISRERFLQFFSGPAQYQVMDERAAARRDVQSDGSR